MLAPAVIPPSLINTHLSLLATGALHGPKTGMGLLSEQTYAGGSNPPPQALVRCCTHLEPPQTSIPCAFDPPPLEKHVAQPPAWTNTNTLSAESAKLCRCWQR